MKKIAPKNTCNYCTHLLYDVFADSNICTNKESPYCCEKTKKGQTCTKFTTKTNNFSVSE